MGKGKCRRTVRGGRKGVGGYSSSEIEVCDIATENRTQMQSQVNRGCPLEESKNQFPVCFLACSTAVVRSESCHRVSIAIAGSNGSTAKIPIPTSAGPAAPGAHPNQ